MKNPCAIIDVDAIGWELAGSSTYDDSYSEDVPADACMFGDPIKIGTTLFHIQAIRVVTDGNGFQSAEDPCLEQDYSYLVNLCGDGPLMTIKIAGHKGEYVLAIYPYAN